MPISRLRRDPSRQCRGQRGESEAASDERENDRMGVVICCWTRSRESAHQDFPPVPSSAARPADALSSPPLLLDSRDGRGAGLPLPPALERSLSERSLSERSLSERNLFAAGPGVCAVGTTRTGLYPAVLDPVAPSVLGSRSSGPARRRYARPAPATLTHRILRPSNRPNSPLGLPFNVAQ
jgi:hypothetical protein